MKAGERLRYTYADSYLNCDEIALAETAIVM